MAEIDAHSSERPLPPTIPVESEITGTGTAPTPADVVEVALKAFSRKSYSDAKLEHIARESGMSKRMIHYYFGDKRGLYKMVVAEAVTRLYPTPERLELDSAIPVEGVRKIVEALYQNFIAQPDAVAMIQMENVQEILDLREENPVFDQSRLILPLERLLMLGQDAGAFRPGISAFDVFFLITSICYRQASQAALVDNIFGVDPALEANIAGIQRMAVDATLAFLTSNMPNTGKESYIEATPSHVDNTDNNQTIYAEFEDDATDLGFSIYGE
ncbi:TetR/AcrR family transcriptional regulator [Corynebacterium caspium]|uniref:TetR/AcrR family transcriptional regulator n=1 Tax=Corynebacterium caspium TaxID=234828 RepID=UPI000363F288|nr:TetR/AcrR family transcriptional regulator [Corynebacterium caspium]WKD58836.1 HTH-type transcriptional repressor NicS [Corynebacterium caspium DSM 44850]